MDLTTFSENTSTSQEGTMNQSMALTTLNTSSPNTIYQYQLSVFVIQIVIGPVIVLLNVVTGIGLVRCRGTNMLLLMLLSFQALSDTFVGIVYIYLSFIKYFGFFIIAECIVSYGILIVTSAWSLITVTMISVERILAIRFPFKHQDTSSSKLVMTLIGLFCLFGPVILFLVEIQFLNIDTEKCNLMRLVSSTFFAVHGTLGVALNLFIIICNIYLFRTSIEHIRRIVPTFVGPDNFKQAIKLNLKATLTTASVTIPFIILNLPMYFLFVVMWINPSLKYSAVSRYTPFVVYTLLVINSAVNPIMYTWRIEELRNQMKRQFGIRKRDSS